MNNMNENMMGNMNNSNKYNQNINSTRANNMQMQDNAFNQNPYINQQANMDPNAMNPVSNNIPNQQPQSIITNGDFVKGALIGAAVTFLLTNKGAQDSIIKAVSKGNEFFQAGMEEVKERYEDAKAQMDAKQE